MSTPTPGQDRKFGALLHTKRLPVINAVVLSPLVLAFLYLALTQPFSAASAGVLAVSVLLGALIVWTLSYRAWIHDLGVRTSSAFGKRELLYKDLRTFSYSRISYNGQVTDTLTFIPQSGKPVRVAVQPRGQDADLARIVNVLAERAAVASSKLVEVETSWRAASDRRSDRTMAGSSSTTRILSRGRDRAGSLSSTRASVEASA